MLCVCLAWTGAISGCMGPEAVVPSGPTVAGEVMWCIVDTGGGFTSSGVPDSLISFGVLVYYLAVTETIRGLPGLALHQIQDETPQTAPPPPFAPEMHSPVIYSWLRHLVGVFVMIHYSRLVVSNSLFWLLQSPVPKGVGNERYFIPNAGIILSLRGEDQRKIPDNISCRVYTRLLKNFLSAIFVIRTYTIPILVC